MKVLLVHNYYQIRGGEDESFEAEAALLESHGHSVVRYTRHNDDIRQMTKWSTAQNTLWNQESYLELRSIIRQHQPQLMHCTNLFPLISPAAYYAARKEGVPVVQSLRNYRLFCANSFLFRDGRCCDDCVRQPAAWFGAYHRCYRDSRSASTVVAAMQRVHRSSQRWFRIVDLYFTPSKFTRQKYIEAGFAPEQISVKPNFVSPDPGPR